MKNKILAAILLFSSYSFAQFGEANQEFTESSNSTKKQIDKNDYYYHARDGFYFTTGITIGHTYLHTNKEQDEDHGKSTSDMEYSGWHTPYTEVRIGGYYEGIASIYGAFGFGVSAGNYEFTTEYKSDRKESESHKSNTKIDASGMKFLLGIGAEFYPIQNKENMLNGIFAGFSGGFIIEGIYIKNYDKDNRYYDDITTSSIGFHRFYGQLEAGYDWWLGKRWRIGAAFNYSFGINTDNNDDEKEYMSYRKEEETTTSHTFGLTLRIAR